MKKTADIHHITAIVGHPQENVDFYAGILGLRMMKKTVNFDDPRTYHLYFANEPGRILFEIATDPPGFAHDESYETTGQNLMLPEQYECTENN